jgi:hypothetical protein
MRLIWVFNIGRGLMKRDGLKIALDASDVESAVRQFVCACYPDLAVGYAVEVIGSQPCEVMVTGPVSSAKS